MFQNQTNIKNFDKNIAHSITCSVSNFDSLWSDPRLGITSRRRSKASFYDKKKYY